MEHDYVNMLNHKYWSYVLEYILFFENIVGYLNFWWSLFSKTAWYLYPIAIFGFIFCTLFLLAFFLSSIFVSLVLLVLPIFLLLQFLQTTIKFELPIIGKYLKTKEINYLKNFKQWNNEIDYKSLQDGNYLTQVIRDFGNFVLENQKLTFIDSKFLPHPKKIILNALLLGIKGTENQQERDSMQNGLLFCLPYFQDNVGDEPISMSPIQDLGENYFNIDENDHQQIDEKLENYLKLSKKNKDKLETLNTKYFADVENFKVLLNKLDDIP